MKVNMTTCFLGCTAYNLGTGRGTSVLEMVAAFEKASGKVIVHPDHISKFIYYSSNIT